MPIIATVHTLNASTPTKIADGGSVNDPVRVIVQDASATIAVGGASVTFASGILLTTTGQLDLELGAGDDLYAIASGATPTVRTLATRS